MACDSASLPDTLSRHSTREQSVHPPPLNLLTYIWGKRSGQQNFVFKVDLQQDKCRYPQTTRRRIDAAFFMKVLEAQWKALPGWTGFNMSFKQDAILPSTNVGYLPVIDASPTDLNTVHAILSHSTATANWLKQNRNGYSYGSSHICQGPNDPLANKLLLRETWDKNRRVSYSYDISDAGFQDILIESELVPAGSIDKVITALRGLYWQGHLDTQEDHRAALKVATDLQKTFPSEQFNASLHLMHFCSCWNCMKNLWKKKTTPTRPSDFGAHTLQW